MADKKYSRPDSILIKEQTSVQQKLECFSCKELVDVEVLPSKHDGCLDISCSCTNCGYTQTETFRMLVRDSYTKWIFKGGQK